MKKFLIAALAVILAAGMLAASLITIASASPLKTEFISIEPGFDEVYLEWNEQDDADGYHINLIPADDTGSAKDILVEGKTNTVITGLHPSSRYYVTVNAYHRVRSNKLDESKRSRNQYFKTTDSLEQPKNKHDAYRVFYKMAKAKGLDDLHIAAILGVYSYESDMDPTSVETIYDEPYMIGKQKEDAEENDYDIDKINKEYAARYPAITKAGIGFGAWTDTTSMQKGYGANTLLRKLARERGKNWYDMDVQFDFWYDGHIDLPQAGYRNWHAREEFEKADTIEEATAIYLCKFVAGWDIPLSRAYEHLRLYQRTENAKKILKDIKMGEYNDSFFKKE